MSKLPVISGRECVKALDNAGFYFKRQYSTRQIICLRADKIFVRDYII